MIQRLLTIVVLIAVTGTGTDAFAQRSRSRRGPEGMVSLFNSSSRNARLFHRIQIELRTNPKQVELLTALYGDMSEQTENTREAASGPESGRTLSRTEQRKLELRINKVSEEIIATVLDAKQFARAKEVTLQMQGYRAFEFADFVKQMKLTKDQQTEIAKILKVDYLSDDGKDDISDILSADQHKRWMKLKGAPFSFPPRRGRSRSRSGGLPEDN